MTESPYFTTIDENGNEEPITNRDIEVDYRGDLKFSSENSCKHKGINEFALIDKTGAFSGEEGEGTTFLFCSKKCCEKFIKETLGLDKYVFDPRPENQITLETNGDLKK
jgi:hypothetical protein